MQRLRIRVIRSPDYHAGDGFHVYGDGGGVMNWVQPLTDRKVLFWDDAVPMADHLKAGHLTATHLDSIQPDRHLDGTFLLDRHLQPAVPVYWDTNPLVFGRFRFAVVTEDEAGNKQTEDIDIHEQTVNSEPPPPYGLCPQSHDETTNELILSFVPSDRLIG